MFLTAFFFPSLPVLLAAGITARRNSHSKANK